jgi:hypothetical protein
LESSRRRVARQNVSVDTVGDISLVDRGAGRELERFERLLVKKIYVMRVVGQCGAVEFLEAVVCDCGIELTG